MGSALIPNKTKPSHRILDPQKVSISVKTNDEKEKGEIEEIISHIKERENRRINQLTSTTLKNFGKVLENGKKIKGNSRQPSVARGMENNTSIQTSDKSNCNAEFIQMPQVYS